MPRLTLRLDDAVVARAKAYAAHQGTSVSHLVEAYLDLLTRPPRAAQENLPPITKRLAGVLKGAREDREAHRRYLVRKYR